MHWINSPFVKKALAVVVFYGCLPALADTSSWYMTERCAPEVQAQVEEWCSGRAKGYCSPLFNDEGYPIRPGYVERIKASVQKISEASERFEIPVEHLIGALITVQVKGGYRTVTSGRTSLKAMPGSGNAKLAPNPKSGDATIEPSPGSGQSLTPNPMSGETKTPAPGSGDAVLAPDPKSGEAAIVPSPNSGDAGVAPNPLSGDASLTPSPLSGDQQTKLIKALPCNDNYGYNNLARLDHNAPRDAESFLAEFEQRDELSCKDLHDAINYNGQDIMYMAALMKRNRTLFTNAEEAHQFQVNYGLAAAVTIYGLADVDQIAERVVGGRRDPRPNTWGLYALCQQPLIEEIKALIPSKQP